MILAELCSRMAYGVKCKIKDYDEVFTLKNITYIEESKSLGAIFFNDKENDEKLAYIAEHDEDFEGIKLYLRSKSSMTDDELKQYRLVVHDSTFRLEPLVTSMAREIDWFRQRHIDYRELIENGLALEAPEGMYEPFVFKEKEDDWPINVLDEKC